MTHRPRAARLARLYAGAVEWLLIGGLAAVVIIAALQVLFRYGLGASLSWSEEALRYLMIWIASLGAGLAYARGEMIGMELLLGTLPAPLARAVALAGRLLIAALMLVVAWYGWQFAWRTRLATATALPISMFWVHLSISVGAALVALHALAGPTAFVEAAGRTAAEARA